MPTLTPAAIALLISLTVLGVLLYLWALLWPLKKAALWMEARRSAYMWCLLSVFISLFLLACFAILVSMWLDFGPLFVLLFAIAFILIPSFCYAAILDTPFMLGLRIFIINAVVSAVLSAFCALLLWGLIVLIDTYSTLNIMKLLQALAHQWQIEKWFSN